VSTFACNFAGSIFMDCKSISIPSAITITFSCLLVVR
jgi:hypothetical protein